MLDLINLLNDICIVHLVSTYNDVPFNYLTQMGRPVISMLVSKRVRDRNNNVKGSLISLKDRMRNKEELFIARHDFCENKPSVDCFYILKAWNLENETFQE